MSCGRRGTQSLRQYLARELRHRAERRSISGVLDEVEAQHGGRVGWQAAVADLATLPAPMVQVSAR